MLTSRRCSVYALLLALSMVSAACEQSKRSDIPGLLPGVEPFEQLANVTLNMTAEELRKLRPGIRNAPYFGFQDSIRGYDVAFRFPKNVRDDMETPMDDKLTLVRAGRTFPSDAEGDTAYRHAVQTVRAILGNPAECFNVVPGRNTVHFARWPVDGTQVYVQHSTADGPPGSEEARALPARVSTVVSRDPPVIPSRLSPIPEPCPTKAP